MADQLTIKNGWLTDAVSNKVGAENGFYYFEDGELKCVLMAAEWVYANALVPVGLEYKNIEDFVEDSDAGIRLALAANYWERGGDIGIITEGQVVRNGVYELDTQGNTEPNKAFFSFDRGETDK